MVWMVLLALSIALEAEGITVAFTNDLHASLPRLPALEPFLRGTDLILDGGDALEDLHRLTSLADAERTLEWMGEVGYSAMVLGNHELYLGPALLELIRKAPFPVVVTNALGLPGVERWALLEVGGTRVLVLGFLGTASDVYIPWSLWPTVRLSEPIAAARDILGKAPDHGLLVILAHMGIEEAEGLSRAVPDCDLLVLGHDHLFLDEPIWVGDVPIVQAGHRAQAVGLVVLGDGRFDYRLQRVGGRLPRLPHPLLLPAVLLVILLLWRG